MNYIRPLYCPNGYIFRTTLSDDFWFAEMSANYLNDIEDTYQRFFDDWKDNIEYMTELAIVTNLLLWDHYGKGRMKLAKKYEDLYFRTQNYVYDHWENDSDAIGYYFRMTD